MEMRQPSLAFEGLNTLRLGNCYLWVPSRDLYPSPRHSACLRGTAPSASANAWGKPLPTVAALCSVKASDDVLKLTQYVVCTLGKSLGYVCILVSCHRRLIDRGLHAIRAGGGAK